MNEREQAREAMARIFKDMLIEVSGEIDGEDARQCLIYADQILAIPGLAILDPDQSLPQPIGGQSGQYFTGYAEAQQDMRMANFKKVVME